MSAQQQQPTKFSSRRVVPPSPSLPQLTVPVALPDNVLMPPRASQDFNFDENSRVPVTSGPSGSPSGGTEVCLNTTGIVVAVALFVILQLILAFVSAHFWHRRSTSRQKTEQDDIAIRRVFNPYTSRK